MTAMTNPEHLEHLTGLRRLKGFPTNEDSAVSVVVRYFADRGVVCTRDEARRIVRDGAFNRLTSPSCPTTVGDGDSF
jgi:hypothetical protein